MLQDVRHALRLARSSPVLVLTAITSLAIGIGATVTMFTLVNSVLLRPVPVESPEELVFLYTGTEDDPFRILSHPDFLDYRDGSSAFRGLAVFGEIQVSLAVEGSPQEIRGLIASGNFFEILGVEAALGRVFGGEDDRVPGEHPVVVLSHSFWNSHFAADPGIVGREIAINGRPYLVLGVAPNGFRGPLVLESYEVYVPMAMQAHVRPPRASFSGEMDPDLLTKRSASWLNGVGRLRPDVSLEEAEASLRSISARLSEAHPETNRGERASLYPLTKIDPRAYPTLKSVAALLLGVSLLVLLVATANVVSLLLARAVAPKARDRDADFARGKPSAAGPPASHRVPPLAAIAGALGLLPFHLDPPRTRALRSRDRYLFVHRRFRRRRESARVRLVLVAAFRGSRRARPCARGLPPRLGFGAPRRARLRKGAALRRAKRIGPGADRAFDRSPHRSGALRDELPAIRPLSPRDSRRMKS